MAIELPDGTILPSYLGVRRPDRPVDTGTHTNIAFRVGEVQEVVYPDDKRNQSGTMVEYVVDVSHADGKGATVTTRYFAVPVGNLFGGVADFTRYTLRARTGDTSKDKIRTLGNGSKVTLLCVNGRTTQALIIGGAHDPNQPDDDKADGHNYEFEFNGANLLINDDGELSIKYQGATDINGDPRKGVDTAKTGATLKFDKDGNWSVTDVPQNIVLKSSGVLTGDATDHTVLGDTYRNAENQMHQQVSAALKGAQGAVGGVAGGLTTAGTQLALSNNAGAAAALATAATALGALASQLSAAAAAIDAFEAQASQYLSIKNKSD
jgi:hypothetical protein